jgi:rare lipoprotein A
MDGRGYEAALPDAPRHAVCRVAGLCAILGAAISLVGCGVTTQTSNQSQGMGLAAGDRLVAAKVAPQRVDPNYKLGKPYKIAGRWYHPEEDPGYDETGLASWYGDDFHGRRTANGEIYDMNALTAAHPTLPMPTYARVTNLENGRSVVVRVNDRGPFAHNRVIDLSKQTARLLGFKHNGTAEVRVQYVGAAPMDGDDEWLTTTVRENGQPVLPAMIAGTLEPGDRSETSALPVEAKADLDLAQVPGFVETAQGADRVANAFTLFDRAGSGVSFVSHPALRILPEQHF